MGNEAADTLNYSEMEVQYSLKLYANTSLNGAGLNYYAI